jgi:molybdate transport system substrate-binding protein
MRALLRNRQQIHLVALGLAVAACGTDAGGRPRAVRVAVAGNFAAPLSELARRFTEQSGIPIEVSIGATGQLYAQIVNGAPFDVFLAADDVRPALLERDGLTASGSRFTYAVGRLVLFVPGRASLASVDVELRAGGIRALALANPHTAPYGAAAQQVLERLGLWDSLRAVVVRGENVSQTFQFVASGAADGGLVALSQMTGRDPGEYRVISDTLHRPIRQEAALLRQGSENPGARALVTFLGGEQARRVIAGFGYDTP